MERKRLAAFFVVCIVAISIAYLEKTGYFVKKEVAIVARVIDGDTLELADGRKVRLLGINAPERNEFYFEEARNELKRLVEGKKVLLESDLVNVDKYGRLLRHVFVDGIFVNLLMIEKGYANAYILRPNVKYSSKLLEAEKRAIEQGVGLWRAQSPYSNCIVLREFDWLGDEHITFGNVCNLSIEITGWKLKNAEGTVYIFPKFVLKAGGNVTLYSKFGVDAHNTLYLKQRNNWNDYGDILILQESNNNLILVKRYGE